MPLAPILHTHQCLRMRMVPSDPSQKPLPFPPVHHQKQPFCATPLFFLPQQAYLTVRSRLARRSVAHTVIYYMILCINISHQNETHDGTTQLDTDLHSHTAIPLHILQCLRHHQKLSRKPSQRSNQRPTSTSKFPMAPRKFSSRSKEPHRYAG